MRRFVYLVLLGALLATGGCVQMRLETTIDKDGSGSAVVSYTMSSEVASALKELSSMDTGMQGQGEMPSLDDMNKEHAEKAAKKYGVKVAKFERSEKDGNQNMEMVVEFDDLANFSRFLGELMDEEDDDEILRIFRKDNGNFLLTSVTDPEAASEPDEEEDAEEPEQPTDPSQMDPQQMQKSMELMGTLMSKMSEFDVRMTFTVPGDIVETSAMSTEGRTAVWHINSQNMMSMQGQDFEPVVEFSGQGLKIDAPKWDG